MTWRAPLSSGRPCIAMLSCSGEVSCLSRWPEPERSPVTLPVVDLDILACGGSSELFEFVDRALAGWSVRSGMVAAIRRRRRSVRMRREDR